jgi:hypothetical protein
MPIVPIIIIAGIAIVFFKKGTTTNTNTGTGTNNPNPTQPIVLDKDRPNKSITFAYYNKNFGNIRNWGAFRYKWEITPTGNIYKMFPTFEGGAAAFITHFKRYLLGDVLKEKGKLNTISKLLYTWAPPSENDTEGYINYVVKNSGYKRDYVITPKDTTAIYKITKAMSYMEGGQQSGNMYTLELFQRAWAMSLKEYPQYA